MFPLIPFTFGNRRPDVFGNVHVRLNDRGRTEFRSPGDYVGRHRRPELPWPLPVLAPLVAWLGGDTGGV